MNKYSILSDYEKVIKLKQVKEEKQRLSKPTYWILKQMGIPKSTYYDWKKTKGQSKSKAPKKVWNKTPDWIEHKVIDMRRDGDLYNSKRSPLEMSRKLEEKGIFIHESTVKRNNLNRYFKEHKKTFLIYPKAERFLDVVCIDDVSITNKKPRDLAVFNAIDEYLYESVGILFITHRINRWDVITLLNQIYKRYKKYPKVVRLDNAQAHKSKAVKAYCKLHMTHSKEPQKKYPLPIR